MPDLPKVNADTPKSAIIIPYMPKGGVGKTTTAAHVGYSLARYGKTLLIDADPQGNLTTHLIANTDFTAVNRTLVDCLTKKYSFSECVITAREPVEDFAGLHLLGTSNNSLELQEYIQSKFPTNPVHLKILITEAIQNNFRFIIIDPPASFGLYTRFLISKATHVIPIIEPEAFGFEAVITLIQELNEIKTGFEASFYGFGPNEKLMAIVNKYNQKTTTHKYHLEQLQKSPFEPIFVISDTGSIPYASTLSMLLHEHQPKNPNVKVFDGIASYLNDSLDTI